MVSRFCIVFSFICQNFFCGCLAATPLQKLKCSIAYWSNELDWCVGRRLHGIKKTASIDNSMNSFNFYSPCRGTACAHVIGINEVSYCVTHLKRHNFFPLFLLLFWLWHPLPNRLINREPLGLDFYLILRKKILSRYLVSSSVILWSTPLPLAVLFFSPPH